MSPEELVEIRYDPANAAIWLPKVVAAHKAQAAQIEALKKEADCSDIVQALEDAGIPMGDGEQDIITAIEILVSRIDAMKEKLVEERAIRLFRVDSNSIFSMWTLQSKEIQDEYKRDARQQLKAEMPGVDWE